MTTLAYKDGILAADTRVTWGNIHGLCRKIHLIDDLVIAIAGTQKSEDRALAWLKGETKSKPKDLPKFEAIAWVNNKPHYCLNTLEFHPIEQKFYACGSGWQVGMSAMHMGLSAYDAIKVAGEMDINTNTLVDYYDVKTKKLTLSKFPK